MMLSLLAVLFLLHFGSATDIATFTDSDCKDSYRNINGPDGFPNGTCTPFQVNGNYSSFQVVDMDPGCTVTIYGGPENADDPCATTPQFATLGQCYNASWVYYSIDSCILQTSTTSSAETASASPSTAVAEGTQTSAATIAGATVGAIVGAALLAGVIFWAMRRRRQSKLKGPAAGDDGLPLEVESSAVMEKDSRSIYPAQELPVPPVEMHAGTTMSHELPAFEEVVGVENWKRS